MSESWGTLSDRLTALPYLVDHGTAGVQAVVRDWLLDLAETLSIPTIDERASRRDAERAEVLRWLADTNDVRGAGEA
jgi:hypothetical protein